MKIRLPEREINAEVADTVLKRALGLSFRKKGKMLFKFPDDTRAPIDMMLMRKSLHLYFMNSEKEVIHVEEAHPWYSIPEKLLHRPRDKYRYLLESFEQLDLEEGEQVSFHG
jgi:uncharacterized membrane protein (UPF0127 family)